MEINEKYMLRCLELAGLGTGSVAPNPMVGCVIVYNGKIIGEGFLKNHGGPHAEVNAINAVSDTSLLKESTLYVSLEPCAHYGLTPPCSNLIVEKQIPHVVIGTIDPFSEVAGKGIEKLKKAGIEVASGVLENQCRELNKRFFSYHEKKRPFIILKWAQTLDGYIDLSRKPEDFGEPTWITGDLALRLVHKIRSEESAILVGTNTAQKDNPSLTVRHWNGKNPLRLVTDKNLQLNKNLKLFDQTEKTVVFNSIKNVNGEKLVFVKLDYSVNIIPQILSELYKHNVLSVIVEGGRHLLQSFIELKLWDEAHIFIGNKFFGSGISAPEIEGERISHEVLDSDHLIVLRNKN